MANKNPIIRTLRIVMPIVAIITVTIVAPLDLLPPWIAPLPDSVQAQLDDAIDGGLDGITLYVEHAGEPPVLYTAGWKDKLEREAADPHALFKIASISKLYIATAVAKLANNGSLSLDETLVYYLPELSNRIEFADQITLRMMVQHRSGIPNFTDQETWNWFESATDIDEALELVLDKPADFEPDARSSYSNTNYLLIGRILDDTLGYSHHQYIADELLAPLGLSKTFSLLSQVEYDDIASGYWHESNEDFKPLAHSIPGGSMIATLQDVGIFLRALIDGSLLNEDEHAIYTSIYEYEHTGWVPGYHSIARYHEDIDSIVVQFVNTTGGETWGTANVIGGKATALSIINYNRIIRILHK